MCASDCDPPLPLPPLAPLALLAVLNRALLLALPVKDRSEGGFVGAEGKLILSVDNNSRSHSSRKVVFQSEGIEIRCETGFGGALLRMCHGGVLVTPSIGLERKKERFSGASKCNSFHRISSLSMSLLGLC